MLQSPDVNCWLTVKETAQRYGITTAAVRAAIYGGRLSSERNEHGVTIIRVWQADELWGYRLLKSDAEWITNEEWLTVPEIAQRYGIDRGYIYKLIRRGQLPAERVRHDQIIVPAKVAHELWQTRLLKKQGFRQCKVCLTVKPIDEFMRLKKPRVHTCRACRNHQVRRWKLARQLQKNMVGGYEPSSGRVDHGERSGGAVRDCCGNGSHGDPEG